MATTTENLGLKNPSYEEMADIGVINDNMKIIDKAYGGLKEDLDKLNKGGLNLKDEAIAEDINNWLDEHPEATTTVQDGSLNEDKFTDALRKKKANYYISVEKMKEDV